MHKQESDEYSKLPIHIDKLSIVAITWNLYGSLPPINSLVELASSSSFQPLPDLIFFGTQQCQRSLCMSFCCEAKGEWEAMLIEAFHKYRLVAVETMGGLHSAIFVHHRLQDHFELQVREKLKAGVCNIMGNKGAISIEGAVFGQNFQFINCHLAPNQNENQKRNATIVRILDSLMRKDLHSQVILLGDLNYRIGIDEAEYGRLISGKKNTQQELNYKSYIKRDQLSNQDQLKRDFLLRFEEGEITFPPTYKIGVNKNEYSRERIPGWTDRIFHRSGKCMRRVSYGCEYGVMGSDHRPVVARYVKFIEENPLTLVTQNYVGVGGKNCQLI